MDWIKKENIEPQKKLESEWATIINKEIVYCDDCDISNSNQAEHSSGLQAKHGEEK